MVSQVYWLHLIQLFRAGGFKTVTTAGFGVLVGNWAECVWNKPINRAEFNAMHVGLTEIPQQSSACPLVLLMFSTCFEPYICGMMIPDWLSFLGIGWKQTSMWWLGSHVFQHVSTLSVWSSCDFGSTSGWLPAPQHPQKGRKVGFSTAKSLWMVKKSTPKGWLKPLK